MSKTPEIGMDDLKEVARIMKINIEELTEKVNAINVGEDVQKTLQSITKNLVLLSQRVEGVADYTLATRVSSVYSNHSIDLIHYSFERKVADTFAQSQSLLSVEAELSERNQSYLAMEKAKSTYSDRLTYFMKYADDIFANQRALSDKNVELEQKTKRQELTIQAATKTIENFAGIAQVIKTKADRKQMPQDLIAELKTIAPEIFAARPAQTLGGLPQEYSPGGPE